MDDDARRRLLTAAAEHHGVVTVALARQLGVTPAQLRTDVGHGVWHRYGRGVLVAAAAPETWEQRVALAIASTGGAASHRTAARLHGLDGPWGDTVEVSVVRPSRRRAPTGTVHQVSMLDPQDLVTVSGLRCTGVARTLVDLGAVVDGQVVEQALDSAARRGASHRWVMATLDRLERPGPTGTGVLRTVLDRPDRRGPLPDSTFERLIERAAVDAGLPQPSRQVRVFDPDGTLIAVLDAAWADRLIASEAQSERWHGGPRGAQRDLDRHNRLTAMGWRMLYATWRDAEHPEEFTRRLAELFRSCPAERGPG